MSTEELAKQLHDKATRGNMLSAAEQAQLEAWYAQQDQEEKAILERATPPRHLQPSRRKLRLPWPNCSRSPNASKNL